ncbi:hypothetical protein [Fusobacterium varium]|jgi:CDP-6-deoxy-D-xylo-4-hexulose-3-dehydrase
MKMLSELKREILEKVKEYHNIRFEDKQEFKEEETYINYGGSV